MSRALDYTGMKFGRLTAVERVFPNSNNGQSRWLFSCDCGGNYTGNAAQVKNGNTSSCGCLYWETRGVQSRTHGKSHTPEYKVWSKMKERCSPKAKPEDLRDYYGRGIRVCERWIKSFENFHADMGERPSDKHSIDRIDVNGNYEPLNCRWADLKTQFRNKRSSFIYDGVQFTQEDVCRFLGVEKGSIRHFKLTRNTDIFGFLNHRKCLNQFITAIKNGF